MHLAVLDLEGSGLVKSTHVQVTRLRYTPRKFVIHPNHNTLIVGEADRGAVPLAERDAMVPGTANGSAASSVLLQVHIWLFVRDMRWLCLLEILPKVCTSLVCNKEHK